MQFFQKSDSSKMMQMTIFLVISSFILVILLFLLNIYNSKILLKDELIALNTKTQNLLIQREENLIKKLKFLSKIVKDSSQIEDNFRNFLNINEDISSLILVRKNGKNLFVNTINKPKEFGFELGKNIYEKDGFYKSDFFYNNGELTKFYALNVDENSYILAYENFQNFKNFLSNFGENTKFNVIVFDENGLILENESNLYDDFNLNYNIENLDFHFLKSQSGYFFGVFSYKNFGVLTLYKFKDFILNFSIEIVTILFMIFSILFILFMNLKFFNSKILYPIQKLRDIFETTSNDVMVKIANLIKSQNEDLGFVAKKIIGFYQDLGDANSEIKFTSQMLKIIFKNNFIIVITINPFTGKIFEVNNAACELYGYSQEEFLHMDIFDILSDSSYDFSMQKIRSFRKKENFFILHHTCKDGKIIVVQMRFTMIDDEKLVCIIFDITNYEKYIQDTAKEQSYISNSPCVMIIFDAKTLNIKQTTKNIKYLWGYDDFNKTDFFSLIHQDDLARVKKEIQNKFEIMQNQVNSELIQFYRIKFSDGIYYHQKVLMKLVKNVDEDDEIVGYFYNYNEIISQDENSKKIIKRYKNILDATSAIAWEWEIGKANFYINENLAKLLGYDDPFSFEQINFNKFKTMITPVDLPFFEKNLQDYISGEIPNLSIKIRLSDKFANSVWIRFQGKISDRDKNGFPTQICGTIEDISLEKEQEDSLRLIANVFSFSHEGIMITDKNGTIVDANEAFTKITGYEKYEVVGQNPRILKSDRQESEFYIQMWNSIIDNGFFSGEIWNKRKNGEIYPEILTISAVTNDTDEITHYISIFYEISSMKEKEAKLERIASYDSLTGLANRLTFKTCVVDNLKKANLNEKCLAICYIDFDGFKKINDTFGHKMGDIFLKMVSNKMQSVLDEGDLLSRLGGDEFAVFINNVENKFEVIRKVNKLLSAASSEFVSDDITMKASASVGVAYYDGELDYDELLRRADIAMYEAKVSGKNRYKIYEIRQDLGHLKYENFFVVYHPIFDVVKNLIIGFEILLRYKDKNLGVLLPKQFLNEIKNDNLKIKIIIMSINEALKMNLKFRLQKGISPYISVNLNFSDFTNESLFLLLKNLIFSNPNFDIKKLIIEIDDFQNDTKFDKIIKQYLDFGIKILLNSVEIKDVKNNLNDKFFGLKTSPRLGFEISQDYKNIKDLKEILSICNKNSNFCVATGVKNTIIAKIMAGLGFRYLQGDFINYPVTSDQIFEIYDKKQNEIKAISDKDFMLFLQAIKHKIYVNAITKKQNIDLERYKKDYDEIIQNIKSKCKDDEISLIIHQEINKQILDILTGKIQKSNIKNAINELKIASEELINIL